MGWTMSEILVFLSLSFFIANVSCTPNCPRNALAFDSNSPIKNIGRGFNPFIAVGALGDDDRLTSPVIELTAGNDYLDLPVSRFRLAIPCESGRGNFGQISGRPTVTFDRVLTTFEEYTDVLSTQSAFDVGLSSFVVGAGFESIETTVSDVFSSVVFSYRAYRQAYVTIDPLPDQSWWSDDFTRLVKQLDNSSSTDSSYTELISTFGTYYVSHVFIGSYIAAHSTVAYCYVQKGQAESGSVFLGGLVDDLEFMAKARATKATSSTTYKQLSDYRVFNAGGDVTKFSQTGSLDDYITSVPSTNNMTVLGRQTIFRGLWTLLPNGDPRRSLLQAAVTTYSAGKTVKPTASLPDCSSSRRWFPGGKVTGVGLLAASIAYMIY